MGYRSEFPDYDGEFYLPDGWEDVSYHNDVCPHAEKKDERLGVTASLWEDYVDPHSREWQEGKRYIFELRIDAGFNYIFSYATDDLDVVKEMINSTHLMNAKEVEECNRRLFIRKKEEPTTCT